ncbi:MAG: gerAA 1 [Firmicutes bacterium]|nr:gerAA 1 [Bacillota bacterium]
METIFSKSFNYLKKLLVYTPSCTPPPFVLDDQSDQKQALDNIHEKTDLAGPTEQLQILLRQAKHAKDVLEAISTNLKEGHLINPTQIKTLLKKLEENKAETSPVRLAYDAASQPEDREVSALLAENYTILKKLYKLPQNKDIVIRNLTLPLSPPLKAIIVFLDGMVDSKTLNLAVLQPLMFFSADHIQVDNISKTLTTTLIEECLPANQVNKAVDYKSVQHGINSGDTALFIDGVPEAVLINTKGMIRRGVDRPMTEQTVRGSQAAFSEGLRINTALIRATLKSSDLVTEILSIGKRTNTSCAIMYVESLANPTLVAEIRRRIKGVTTDFMGDIGSLQQFIEDHPGNLFPQALSTERPDRVAVHLAEGRVAFILDGIPFAHIVPVSFFTFFHSAEDFSFKAIASTGLRILRIVAAFITLLLPSLYLAINYFHQEALPTEITLAVAGARERVPFPAFIEIILMEFSFELIREGGLRIPGVLGSTIGIVGALILGQAAVTANIVSPIVVIIIALAGLASFAIPDFQMALAFRAIRFLFLLLAAGLGLVGVASGLLLLVLLLCSMKSFGVPYMVPIAPRVESNLDVIVRGPVFHQEKRPDGLNAQDSIRQPAISREWELEKPSEGQKKP